MFKVRACLSTGHPVASLSISICVVIGMGAKEQVVRVAATWYVACVANTHPLRYLAFPHHVSRYVATYLLSASTTELQLSIFAIRWFPGENPTSSVRALLNPS